MSLTARRLLLAESFDRCTSVQPTRTPAFAKSDACNGAGVFVAPRVCARQRGVGRVDEIDTGPRETRRSNAHSAAAPTPALPIANATSASRPINRRKQRRKAEILHTAWPSAAEARRVSGAPHSAANDTAPRCERAAAKFVPYGAVANQRTHKDPRTLCMLNSHQRRRLSPDALLQKSPPFRVDTNIEILTQNKNDILTYLHEFCANSRVLWLCIVAKTPRTVPASSPRFGNARGGHRGRHCNHLLPSTRPSFTFDASARELVHAAQPPNMRNSPAERTPDRRRPPSTRNRAPLLGRGHVRGFPLRRTAHAKAPLPNLVTHTYAGVCGSALSRTLGLDTPQHSHESGGDERLGECTGDSPCKMRKSLATTGPRLPRWMQTPVQHRAAPALSNGCAVGCAHVRTPALSCVRGNTVARVYDHSACSLVPSYAADAKMPANLPCFVRARLMIEHRRPVQQRKASASFVHRGGHERAGVEHRLN
ncbi:hypothetical protein C8R43DRAFT_1142105 [Mycena crocata]|nr:hypothetical protein C8R43DRAFT_1142105 [Mycena crocata]